MGRNDIETRKQLVELSTQEFELEQRRSMALSKSAFFPKDLQGDVASAVIIYDLAQRMDISVMEVSQSVYIIYGRPSFSTTFMVARLNQSGLIKGTLRVIVSSDKQSAYCEAIDAVTGETVRGMTVTMEMARLEGWISKKGSKWQTMPELMLRKRCQSFFIKEFYPQVMFGLQSAEEVEDIIDTQPLPQDDNKPLKMKIPKASRPQPAPTPTPAVEPDAVEAEYDDGTSEEVQAVAEQVHKEADKMMGKPVAKAPTPQQSQQTPPKRKRRTKAEIEELLIEINTHEGTDYKILSEVPAKQEKEGQERLDFKKACKDESIKETEAKYDHPQETPIEEDNIPSWEETTEAPKQAVGHQDPYAGIPKPILDQLQFFINQGLPAADFKKFIEFANIDTTNIDYFVEDVAYTIEIVSEWKKQTGKA